MRANASEPPGGIRTASGRRKPAIPFWKLASAAFGYKRRTPRPRTSTVRALMAAPTCPARAAQAPHLSMAAPAPALCPVPSRNPAPAGARPHLAPTPPLPYEHAPRPCPCGHVCAPASRAPSRHPCPMAAPAPHSSSRHPAPTGAPAPPPDPRRTRRGAVARNDRLSRPKWSPQTATRDTRRRCGIAPRRRKTFPTVKASLDSGRMLVSVR